MSAETMKRKYHLKNMEVCHVKLDELSYQSRQSNISYNGVCRPLIQLPRMQAAFGVSKFSGPYGDNYSLSLNFPPDDIHAKNFFEELERLVVRTFPSKEFISCMKTGTSYPDRIRVELDVGETGYIGLAMDHNNVPMVCAVEDIVKKNDHVTCLLEMCGVWHSGRNKVGLKMRAIQLKNYGLLASEATLHSRALTVQQESCAGQQDSPTQVASASSGSNQSFLMLDD